MNIIRAIDWTTFKAFAALSLPYKYIENSDSYLVYVADSPFTYECTVLKDSSTPQTEFESTYKSVAFSTFSQMDTDGAAVVRNKAAKKGWTYAAIPIEFQTAKLSDSVYSKLADGTDRAGITLKAYDISDVEVTVPGTADANLATIVKTVLDLEFPYDYELIGGSLRTLTSIVDDMRLWIIAVPDIPAGSGGSKEMTGGLNLRYLAPGNEFRVDGRVSKYLSYNATYHTNKLRFIFTYPAGVNESLLITMEIYKA